MNLSFLNDKTPLEAALYYAKELGWPVFPVWYPTRTGEDPACSCGSSECTNIGKHPIGLLVPNGVKDATISPEIIRRWWAAYPSANLAVATGRGVVVMDVDAGSDEKEYDGFKSLAEAVILDAEILQTLSCETGGDGRHLYQRIPSEIGRIGNPTPWKGINIKGDGGYVLASPSLHASGKRYRWMDEDRELLTMSLDLAKRLRRSEENKETLALALSETKIPRGQRNTVLYSLACSHRSHGVSYDDAEGVIRLQNYRRCVPPLHDEEVVGIVQRAYEKLPAFHLTDLGNANWLEHYYGSEAVYILGRGWVEWSGGSWEERSDIEMQKWSHLLTGALHAAAKEERDPEWRKRLFKHADASESDARLNAMIRRWRSLHPRHPTEFNLHNMLIPCANGTYDLRNNVFRAPRKEDLMIGHFPVMYDPNAKCPVWESSIETWSEGDQEMIAFLRRMVGYFITGDTSLHCLFILYGPGGTGKTTFTKTVQAMMGEYALTIATDLLMERAKINKETETMRLYGRRLAVCPESSHEAKMDIATVKNLTGDDKARGRELYLKAFDFEVTHKIILFTNERPIVPSWDTGARRRLRLVPFPQVIQKDRINRYLTMELLKELPGILNWAIEGCRDWLLRGELGEAEKVSRETEKYWRDMDIIGMFLEEKYEYKPSGRVKRSELYPEYVTWCGENRTYPLRKGRFLEDLRSRGELKETEIEHEWYFEGLSFIGRSIQLNGRSSATLRARG